MHNDFACWRRQICDVRDGDLLIILFSRHGNLVVVGQSQVHEGHSLRGQSGITKQQLMVDKIHGTLAVQG